VTNPKPAISGTKQKPAVSVGVADTKSKPKSNAPLVFQNPFSALAANVIKTNPSQGAKKQPTKVGQVGTNTKPIANAAPIFQNPFGAVTGNTVKPKATPSPETKKRLEAKRAEAQKKKEELQKKRQEVSKAQRLAAEASKKRKVEAQLAAKKAKEAKEVSIRQKKKVQSKAILDAELEAKRIQDAESAKARQKEALEAIQNAVSRATVSLFGLGKQGDKEKEEEEEEDRSPFAKQQKTPSGAPKGVPTLKGWRKTKDGAVTGRLFGSKSFGDGERVTTSPIAFGKVAKGEIVKTSSGSKYFLN